MAALRFGDRTLSNERTEQHERVFRCRLLILARDQSSVLNHVGIVGRDSAVSSARFFQDGLWVVRYQEGFTEYPLQLLISFKRVSRHLAAANAVEIIPERNCPVPRAKACAFSVFGCQMAVHIVFESND
jgi:hypothetical protein